MENFLVIILHSMGVQRVDELESKDLETAQRYCEQYLQQPGVKLVALASINPETGRINLETFSDQTWSLRPDWFRDFSGIGNLFNNLIYTTLQEIREMNEE